MTSTGWTRRTVAYDALGLALLPLLLTAIHFLVPPAVEETFVLRPGAVTPLTLFSAAFFHLGLDHLLGNLAGYGIGVGYAYLLCFLADERRWFWASTAALVFGLPVLVNWLSIRIMNAVLGGWAAPMRGFSGVSAGFGGLAFVALLVYIRKRSDPGSAFFVGLGVLLLLLWEVLLIYADGVPTVGTVAMLLGVGLVLVEVARRLYYRGLPDTPRAWLSAGFTAAILAWMVIVLGVLIVGMFPADLVVDGRFTNIFAHSTGFLVGIVIAGWGYRYWRRRPSLTELWRIAAE